MAFPFLSTKISDGQKLQKNSERTYTVPAFYNKTKMGTKHVHLSAKLFPKIHMIIMKNFSVNDRRTHGKHIPIIYSLKKKE